MKNYQTDWKKRTLPASCRLRHFELNFVDPQKNTVSIELAIVTNLMKNTPRQHKQVHLTLAKWCDTLASPAETVFILPKSPHPKRTLPFKDGAGLTHSRRRPIGTGKQPTRPAYRALSKGGQKRINNDQQSLVLLLAMFTLLIFIANNNHDTTVSIVITLQALGSLKLKEEYEYQPTKTTALPGRRGPCLNGGVMSVKGFSVANC